jgi:cytoskeletal protein CcmA (bactofilin family)
MTSSAETTAEVVIDSDINKTAGSLEIPYNTKINGNVTMNLGDLIVIGLINGNVFSDFGQIDIIGVVNGNVETNMGQIKVDGEVGGDVKARMGDVFINGIVGGKLISDLGKSIVNGRIEGDIDSGSGELLINGSVAGNVKSKDGDIIITGTVNGDVTLDQGIVELGPQAVVEGRIYVGSGLIKKAESSIAGSLEIGEEPEIYELEETNMFEDIFNGLRIFMYIMIGFTVVGGIYLIPSIIAHKSNHPNKAAIIVLNILAGWTFIVWVISLVWALTKPQERIREVVYFQENREPIDYTRQSELISPRDVEAKSLYRQQKDDDIDMD